MNILRRIGLGFAAFLFSTGLSAMAVLIAINAVFATPVVLKDALRGSGLYTVLVQSMIAPQVDVSTSVLAGVVTPKFAQQTTEAFIDSTYDWVQGRSAAPTLDQVTVSLQNGIIATLRQRLTELPVCTDTAPLMQSEDLSTLTCLPPGMSAESIIQDAQDQLSASRDITAGSASQKQQENQLADQLMFIPVFYQIVQAALYVVPVVIIVALIGVVFWSATRRSGVKRIAWILITVGTVQIVIAFVGSWILHQMAVQSVSNPVTLQSGLLTFFDGIVSRLSAWWVGIGIAYGLFGIGILLVIYLVGKRQKVIPDTSVDERIDLNDIK
jgi:hypothetical protein